MEGKLWCFSKGSLDSFFVLSLALSFSEVVKYDL